ncbi:hypothetical protein [Bacillus suaedaesalsae]|uniref:Uncharacterized protein n=1 Tax=Bacillus suaedaesalsae TaxID=2810349 RepID=A0ABS2DIH3_9BACI|nr:hypothetical protein [Bacillus suaedaesalsae]MBM6618207.1 hypothetical protein [Bacillus suaedaesalsae]
MYIKNEIKDQTLVKNYQTKIGMDAARFKYISHLESEEFLGKVKGKVCHVGRDFVDVKRDDHSIISVPFNKIGKINWLDKKSENRFCSINGHRHCKCVELGHSFNHCHQHHHTSMQEKRCNICNRSDCDGHCYGHKDKKNRNKKHCSCPHQHHKREERCNICDRINCDGHGHRTKKSHNKKHCEHCKQKHRNCKNNRRDDHLGDRLHGSKFNKHHKYHDQTCFHCRNDKDGHNKHLHDFHRRFTCFCDFPIPFCENLFQLRLAGLNDGLHFDLMQNQGSNVLLELS